MICIAVCDTDREFMELVQSVAEKTKGVHVELFSHVKNLCEVIKSGQAVDVAILPVASGLRAARHLRDEFHWLGQIIFVSDTMEYDTSIFEVRPIGYWVKPVNAKMLRTYLANAISLAAPCERCICYKDAEGKVLVPIKTICFITSHLRKVLIRTETSKYESYMKLESLSAQLVGAPFFQSHQSFIVNSGYVQKVFRDHIELKNGQIVPLSRKYKEEVFKRFFVGTNEGE